MAPTAGEVLDWVRSARVTLYIWLYFGLSLLIGLLMRLRPDPYTSREAMYVRLVGELWLNAVRAVGLPLLVCSLACAIYDLGLRASAKYGLFLLLWSVASKLLAGLLAAGLSALVQPGARTGDAAAAALAAAPPPSQRLALGDAVLDLLRAALPENPVEACVRYAHALRAAAPNGTAPGTDDPFSYKESSVYVYQADMLGVVVGTSAVGVAMALLGESAVNLVEVSTAVRDTCMVLTRWLMAPAGPCLLLAIVAKLAGAYNISEQIEAMLPLVWSLALTFGVQLVLYLVVYEAVVARRDLKRLLRLMWHQSEAVVTALASSSAHVAYPVAYRGLVEKHGAEQHSASLLLAAASVLNADGSAALLAAQGLWAVQRQALAVPGHYAAAVGLGLLGSVAAFGEVRMHANLLVMVLTTLGAHSSVQDIAPLLVVSWLLDPLASLVNVASAVAAAATLSAVRERELQMKVAAD